MSLVIDSKDSNSQRTGKDGQQRQAKPKQTKKKNNKQKPDNTAESNVATESTVEASVPNKGGQHPKGGKGEKAKPLNYALRVAKLGPTGAFLGDKDHRDGKQRVTLVYFAGANGKEGKCFLWDTKVFGSAEFLKVHNMNNNSDIKKQGMDDIARALFNQRVEVIFPKEKSRRKGKRASVATDEPAQPFVWASLKTLPPASASTDQTSTPIKREASSLESLKELHIAISGKTLYHNFLEIMSENLSGIIGRHVPYWIGICLGIQMVLGKRNQFDLFERIGGLADRRKDDDGPVGTAARAILETSGHLTAQNIGKISKHIFVLLRVNVGIAIQQAMGAARASAVTWGMLRTSYTSVPRKGMAAGPGAARIVANRAISIFQSAVCDYLDHCSDGEVFDPKSFLAIFGDVTLMDDEETPLWDMYLKATAFLNATDVDDDEKDAMNTKNTKYNAERVLMLTSTDYLLEDAPSGSIDELAQIALKIGYIGIQQLLGDGCEFNWCVIPMKYLTKVRGSQYIGVETNFVRVATAMCSLMLAYNAFSFMLGCYEHPEKSGFVSEIDGGKVSIHKVLEQHTAKITEQKVSMAGIFSGGPTLFNWSTYNGGADDPEEDDDEDGGDGDPRNTISGNGFPRIDTCLAQPEDGFDLVPISPKAHYINANQWILTDLQYVGSEENVAKFLGDELTEMMRANLLGFPCQGMRAAINKRSSRNLPARANHICGRVIQVPSVAQLRGTEETGAEISAPVPDAANERILFGGKPPQTGTLSHADKKKQLVMEKLKMSRRARAAVD